MNDAFLDTEEKKARLTVFVGLDDFGHGVLKLVRRQLSVLPGVLQHSTRFVSCSSDNQSSLSPEIQEARNNLTTPGNTEDIKSVPGWEILDKGGMLAVHHHVVGKLESIKTASNLASIIQERNTVDSATGIVFSDNVEEEIDIFDEKKHEHWSQLFCTSLTNRSGVHFNQAEVQSSIAGALLAFTANGVPDPGTNTSALGCAGLYGLTGPALRHLAIHLARDLIDFHRSGEELNAGDGLPDRMQNFAEEHSPQELGKRLLLDPDLQPQKTVEDTPLAVESIPTTPSWDGDQLSVRLSEGRLGLDLAPRGEEERWASQIQEYARSFDMTIGYKWRRQLEDAASRLSTEIGESFGTRIRSFLDNEPHSPVRVKQLLQLIEEQIQDAKPAENQIPDLDSAIQELEASVAKRPNRLVLSLRLAVWVVPALVAGSIALNGLYEGTRGVVFPGLLLFFGGALATGWALWRIHSAREEMQNAREHVLGLVADRQEALLAENTADYLNDEVLRALDDAVDEGWDTLETYEQALEDTHGKLSAEIRESLDTPLTFEPILSQPEEYDRLLERSVDDRSEWLERAVNDGIFDNHEEMSSRLVNWCKEQLEDRLNDHSVSTLVSLWKIREEVRENEDDLGDALSSLWDFSAPLLKDDVIRQYDPESISKTQQVLLPEHFDDNKMDLESSDIPKDALQELKTAPILICLQTRAMSVGRSK